MSSTITITRVAPSPQDDSTPGFTTPIYDPAATNATADIDAIETALSGGNSVDIRTNSGTGGTGDIGIATGQTITKSGVSGTATLRLNAEHNITINSNVTIQQSGGTLGTDKLNVVLNADSDANGTGSILIAGTTGNITNILTRGGDVSIGGRDTTLVGTVGSATTYASSETDTVTGAQIQFTTINSGGGNIAIAGHGFNGTNAGFNRGVIIQVTSDINAAGGNITINGVGGTGNSENYGVAFGAGTDNFLRTVGAGAITVNGTGGTGISNGGNEGVLIGDGTISAENGPIAITGVAGASGGIPNHGIRLGANVDIVSTGNGAITLTGTGNNGGAGIAANSHQGNFGPGEIVRIGQGDTGTYSGNISLNSLGGTNIALGGAADVGRGPGVTQVTTTGTVSMNAAGAGIITLASGSSISGTTSVSLTAGDIVLAGTVTSSGEVTLTPSTNAATIGVNDASKDFKISDAELDLITAPGVTIGSATNTGGISVAIDNAITIGAKNLHLLTGANIAVGGNDITTTGNVTFEAGLAGIVGAITTGAGTVATNLLTATALNGIALNTNASTLSATNTGTSGSINITEANGVTVTALQQTNAGNVGGAVTLTSTTGNIGLNDGAVVSQGGQISLFASAGAITDADTGTTASITGNSITFLAATGFGSAEAIDTNVNTFSGTNSTSGDIRVREATGIDLAGISTQGGNGNIEIVTVNGSITTSSTVIANGSGSVTLTAGGTGSTLTVTGGVSSTSGSITLGAADALTLSGSVSTTGALTLNAAGTTTLNLSLGGLGSLTTDAGGTTAINGGSVSTTGAQTYHDAVTLGNAANLIGTAITLDSTVTTNGNTLTLTNSDAGLISGAISGGGGFTQAGAGTTTLAAANGYAGLTTINAGTLLVDGSITGSTTVNNGGTLGGNGTTGAVNVASGGTLSAGHSPGTLTMGDLSLSSGAIFKEEIGGTTPGVTGYDQIVVNGTVNLGGATLNVSLVNAFVLSGSSTASFTIIDNDGTDAVTGQFAGLVEGAALTIGTAAYVITYQGGTNSNDVVLLAANDAPQFTGLDNAPNFTENGAAVLLDNNATVSDLELDALNGGAGNYDGAVLTLARNGGANTADVFGTSGALTFSGSDVLIGATTVGTFTNAGGALQITFNANATTALVDSVLQQITYANGSEDPPASVQINYSLNDGNTGSQGTGAGIGSGSITVAVQQINDEPTLTATGTNPAYTENSAPATLFSGATASTIEAAQTITSMTLTVSGLADGPNELLFIDGSNVALVNGNVVVTATNGLTVNVSVSAGTATVSFTGASLSATALQTLVNGLGYSNGADAPTESARTVTITQIVDSGPGTSPDDNTATLGIVSTVGVTATNDIPTFTGDGDASSFTENGAPVVLDVNNNASISDPDLNLNGDYGGTSLTIARNGGANPDDVFGVSSPVDLSDGNNIRLSTGGTVIGTYSIDDGKITFAFNASALPGDINFLMRHITYLNSSENPPATVQVDFTFNDGNGQPGGQDQGNGAAPGVGVGTFTVNITQVDDAPILLDVAPAAAYAIGSAGIILSNALTVIDVDAAPPSPNPGIQSAEIRITDFVAGDQLLVNLPTSGGFFIVDDGSGPVVTNISITGNAGGVLTLGGQDTTQHYQAVLDAVNYRSTAPDPSNAGTDPTRTITWQVSDGALNSQTPNTDPNNLVNATILHFDQPPVIDLDASSAGTGFTTTFTEGGAAIAIADTDLSVTDPDTATLSRADIVLTNAKAGDALSIAGALPVNMAATIDTSVAGKITLRITGGLSVADFQTAIGQVRFATNSLDLTDRDVTVQVFESEADGNVAHATVHVAPLTATGTTGNDSYTAIAGAELIDAGAGIDTITFNFRLVDATVTYSGNKVIIDGPGSHSVLSGFEVFNFTDGTVNNNDGDVLVDDLFYYATYHDVWTAHADADSHYHNTGWHEGRNPDAFFQTAVYLSANPDVRAAGLDPLKHFDSNGWKEGRIPSINFDPAAYLAANPDVKAAGVDPLAHFLGFGAGEGRQPIAPSELVTANGFDYVYYLQHNPDVAASGVDPFQHFQTVGWKEGRNPNALFDTTGYLNTYTDVKAANINPLDHYNQFGWHEGRDPSVGFDTTSYLSAYADVNAAHVNPLVHFLQYGIHEGRLPFADGVWG